MSKLELLDKQLDRSVDTSLSPAVTMSKAAFKKARRSPLAACHSRITARDHARLYSAMLRALNEVRHCCFGNVLRCDVEGKVDDFTKKYLATGSSITSSVHQVMRHVVPFVKKHGPLGPYGEYTGENVHQAFKKHNNSRYPTKSPNNKKYMPRMRDSVATFNSRNAG